MELYGIGLGASEGRASSPGYLGFNFLDIYSFLFCNEVECVLELSVCDSSFSLLFGLREKEIHICGRELLINQFRVLTELGKSFTVHSLFLPVEGIEDGLEG